MEEIKRPTTAEEIDDFQRIYNSIDASLFPNDRIYAIQQREAKAEAKAKKEKRKLFWYDVTAYLSMAVLMFTIISSGVFNNKVSSMARQVVSAPFVDSHNYKGVASSIAYANKDAHALIYSYFKEFDYSSDKMDQVFANISEFVNSDPSLQNPETRRAIGYSSFAAYLHGNGFTTAKEFVRWGDKLLLALGINDEEKRTNMISEYLGELSSTQDHEYGVNSRG